MRVQDTIGCFAQIERSKESLAGALSSQKAIYFLTLKSDEVTAEVEFLSTRGWRKFATVLQAINNLVADGLLHILHSSGLGGDHSGSLVVLRDWDDLYRHLSPRLEELDTVQLIFKTELGESVISVRKHVLEPPWPLTDRILRVSSESIRSSSGTVPGNEREDTGWIDDLADAELIRFLHDLSDERTTHKLVWEILTDWADSED
jgi:hypothetical protein